MITECPNCEVPLVMGKAIDDHGDRGCFGGHTITTRNPVIIDCLKCPKCGHSDDGK